MFEFKKMIKPSLIVAFFTLLLTGLYYTGCFEYFKWSVWQEIHGDIKAFVGQNLILSLMMAIFLYFTAILSFIPGLMLFDLIIGYMFPQAIGMFIIMTGSAVGSLVIAFACRFGFKKYFLKGEGRLLQKIERGFAKNETMYLFFLRFVPFFPLALVSAALSSLKISYKKLFLTTFFGMIPVSFALTTVGRSLGELLKRDQIPPFTEIVGPEMLAALFVLSLICILPLFIKRFAKQ
jgi:uncharacterized membrane protein YdjX (TVP38/TMEM64 family)